MVKSSGLGKWLGLYFRVRAPFYILGLGLELELGLGSKL